MPTFPSLLKGVGKGRARLHPGYSAKLLLENKTIDVSLLARSLASALGSTEVVIAKKKRNIFHGPVSAKKNDRQSNGH
jgi:hypothetical protein